MEGAWGPRFTVSQLVRIVPVIAPVNAASRMSRQPRTPAGVSWGRGVSALVAVELRV